MHSLCAFIYCMQTKVESQVQETQKQKSKVPSRSSPPLRERIKSPKLNSWELGELCWQWSHLGGLYSSSRDDFAGKQKKRGSWSGPWLHRCSPLTALLHFLQVAETVAHEQQLCRKAHGCGSVQINSPGQKSQSAQFEDLKGLWHNITQSTIVTIIQSSQSVKIWTLAEELYYIICAKDIKHGDQKVGLECAIENIHHLLPVQWISFAPWRSLVQKLP